MRTLRTLLANSFGSLRVNVGLYVLRALVYEAKNLLRWSTGMRTASGHFHISLYFSLEGGVTDMVQAHSWNRGHTSCIRCSGSTRSMRNGGNCFTLDVL